MISGGSEDDKKLCLQYSKKYIELGNLNLGYDILWCDKGPIQVEIIYLVYAPVPLNASITYSFAL